MPKTGEATEEEIIDGDPNGGGEEVDPNVQALEILKGIEQTLKNGGAATKTDPPAGTPKTVAEYRERVKAETGWSDAQVDFHLRSLGESQAVVLEKLNMNELEKKYKDDFAKHRPAMEEELKRYPAHMKGDALLLENIYFMVKGRAMTTTPPNPNPNPGAPPRKNPAGQPTRRIVTDFPDPASDAGGGGGGGGELTAEEKNYARVLGVSEEQYAESKKSQVIKRRS